MGMQYLWPTLSSPFPVVGITWIGTTEPIGDSIMLTVDIVVSVSLVVFVMDERKQRDNVISRGLYFYSNLIEFTWYRRDRVGVAEFDARIRLL